MLAAIFKATRGHRDPDAVPADDLSRGGRTFGSDKPDRRFGMELVDFGDVFRASSFKVFRGALDAGGVVKAINAKGFRRHHHRPESTS